MCYLSCRQCPTANLQIPVLCLHYHRIVYIPCSGQMRISVSLCFLSLTCWPKAKRFPTKLGFLLNFTLQGKKRIPHIESWFRLVPLTYSLKFGRLQCRLPDETSFITVLFQQFNKTSKVQSRFYKSRFTSCIPNGIRVLLNVSFTSCANDSRASSPKTLNSDFTNSNASCNTSSSLKILKIIDKNLFSVMHQVCSILQQ